MDEVRFSLDKVQYSLDKAGCSLDKVGCSVDKVRYSQLIPAGYSTSCCETNLSVLDSIVD